MTPAEHERGGLQIGIELEQLDHLHTAGDTLKGKVRIETDAAVKCESLWIRRLWQAEASDGQVDRGGQEDDLLATDESWSPGAKHRRTYPFKLPAGDSPATHRGPSLRVSWFVEVEARLVGSDPVVVRQEYPQISSGPKAHKKGKALMLEVPDESDEDGPGCAIFLMLAAFVGALVAASEDAWYWFAGAAAVGLVGLSWLRQVRKFRRARRRLGDVEITLRPPKVNLGSATIATVSFHPNRDLELAGATLTLVQAQHEVHGKKRNQRRLTTNAEEVCTRALLEAPRHFAADQDAHLAAVLPVPLNAPPTHCKPREQTEWTVRLDLDFGPGLRDTKTLVVLDPSA